MRWTRTVARSTGEVQIGFWCGNPRERDHLEDRGVDGSIILQWISKKWDGRMNWIELAQDSDKWRAPVNEVKNYPVP